MAHVAPDSLPNSLKFPQVWIHCSLSAMLNINDEPDLGFEDDDGPWAAPDDMQYDRTEAEIEASHKKFGSRPFRELLEGLVIEKLQDPQIRLVSHS